MTLHLWTTMTTAAPWTVIADDSTVLASGFAAPDVLQRRLNTELSIIEVSYLPGISDAVDRYLGGETEALDKVTVQQPGGPFQQVVWSVMREIAAGTTWSYAELATKAGRPTAVRAAATACARNLVAPFVPCHRIVRSDGSLGGYAYGLPVKQWLLDHEALTNGAND